MKTIKFAAFLFYRYYSKGSPGPYFRTLWSLTFLGFMHLMQLFIVLDKIGIIHINSSKYKDLKEIMFLSLMTAPIYFILALIIKKKDLQQLKEKYEYEWDKVFDGNVRLVVYIIVSLFSIVILASIKSIQ